MSVSSRRISLNSTAIMKPMTSTGTKSSDRRKTLLPLANSTQNSRQSIGGERDRKSIGFDARDRRSMGGYVPSLLLREGFVMLMRALRCKSALAL